MTQQRNTVQRQIILDTLKKMRVHPTIDDLYADIHMGHPSISKSTVYRNLRQLAHKGAIRQVSLPDGLERYDGETNPHYHFKCTGCGHILDLDIRYLTGMNDKVQEEYGVQVDRHDIVFSGLCQKCQG